MSRTSKDADDAVEASLAVHPTLIDRVLDGSVDAFVELLEVTGARVSSITYREV